MAAVGLARFINFRATVNIRMPARLPISLPAPGRYPGAP
jgi:hypothetical protein